MAEQAVQNINLILERSLGKKEKGYYMNDENKIKSLERILEKAKDIKIRESSDPEFKVWKDLFERSLSRVFGEQSKELK